MKYLPLALLTSCTDLPEECQPQIDHFEEVCSRSEVIGSNDNRELYEALDRVQACTGDQVHAVCSDPGLWSKPSVTWYTGDSE